MALIGSAPFRVRVPPPGERRPVDVGDGAYRPPTRILLSVTLEQAGRAVTIPAARGQEPGAAWVLLAGVEGFDDPAMAPSTTGFAGGYGASVTGIGVGARELLLPVLIDGDAGWQWQAARQAIDGVANPLLGPTRITVTSTGGVSRFLDATRQSTSLAWSRDTWTPTGIQVLPLQFVAGSPWWRAAGALNVSPWVQGASGGFLGDEFLPLLIGAAGTFGADRLLRNGGQVDAYPTFTLTASSPSDIEVTVTHVETGRAWVLDMEGVSGTITVDTDPASTAVRYGDGSSAWALLAAPFDLWPLPPGEQTVRVDVTGSAAGLTVGMSGDSLHFRAVP